MCLQLAARASRPAAKGFDVEQLASQVAASEDVDGSGCPSRQRHMFSRLYEPLQSANSTSACRGASAME